MVLKDDSTWVITAVLPVPGLPEMYRLPGVLSLQCNLMNVTMVCKREVALVVLVCLGLREQCNAYLLLLVSLGDLLDSLAKREAHLGFTQRCARCWNLSWFGV